MTEGDFFRQPLREQLKLKYPLVGLGGLINWERLDAFMSESFVDSTGLGFGTGRPLAIATKSNPRPAGFG